MYHYRGETDTPRQVKSNTGQKPLTTCDENTMNHVAVIRSKLKEKASLSMLVRRALRLYAQYIKNTDLESELENLYSIAKSK